jgi:hypothetical protein
MSVVPLLVVLILTIWFRLPLAFFFFFLVEQYLTVLFSCFDMCTHLELCTSIVKVLQSSTCVLLSSPSPAPKDRRLEVPCLNSRLLQGVLHFTPSGVYNGVI